MEPHSQSLLDILVSRLAEDQVPEAGAALVLGACAGEAELAAALDGKAPDLPTPRAEAGTAAGPVFLESVTVAGFRGIGPSASLRLQPQPGLTLVVGRNGSGKSSFAEAAELCLTGTSPRFEGAGSVFREGWRNLHAGSPCQIGLTLRLDGQAGRVQVTRDWQDGDTAVGEASVTVVADGRCNDSVDALGWAGALSVYRPFLTAGDFGRLISSRPSELFDALSPILGLEPLTDADQRLLAARRQINDRIKALKSDRESLGRMLAGVEDERARAAGAILARRQPDLAALDEVLATGADAGADPVAAACRRLAESSLPDPASVLAAADRLAAAAESIVLAGGGSRAAQEAAGLLASALGFHRAHGDGPCPVCRTGALDSSWRVRAEHWLDTLRAEASEAAAATRRREAALSEARALWAAPGTPTQADLAAAGHVLDATGTGASLGPPPSELGPTAALAAALGDWLELGRDPGRPDLPERMRAVYPGLHEAFLAAREAAAGWLRRRHDAWREPAAALETWLERARRGEQDAALVASINAARQWLRAVTEQIRAARLAPFAQRSQQVWQRLRQESNVELDQMQLEGTANRRRVKFPAAVDGVPAPAMAVMSHGELQALGLAVFLPRACAEDSPFRFLLIDDPVHSMDPAKVDGLAQALEELAATRQVVVFTHDNRLPEAVRRLAIDATIWEVARRRGSAVDLRKSLDPVTRHLKDARDVASAAELPEEVRWAVVAGFCRSAIEAALHERIRRERLARGESHAAVEELIDAARTLTQTAALALFSDAHRTGQVLSWLNRRFGRWAGDVFKSCQETVHGAGAAPVQDMVEKAKRLAGELR